MFRNSSFFALCSSTEGLRIVNYTNIALLKGVFGSLSGNYSRMWNSFNDTYLFVTKISVSYGFNIYFIVFKK